MIRVSSQQTSFLPFQVSLIMAYLGQSFFGLLAIAACLINMI